jgi:hypothetical protein
VGALPVRLSGRSTLAEPGERLGAPEEVVERKPLESEPALDLDEREIEGEPVKLHPPGF